jgi:hypothetical protein
MWRFFHRIKSSASGNPIDNVRGILDVLGESAEGEKPQGGDADGRGDRKKRVTS